MKTIFKVLEEDRCPLAIVGISCRLPDGANDPETYYKKLFDKENFLSDMKTVNKRYNLEYYKTTFPQNHVRHISCPTMGLIDMELKSFDNESFGISVKEAIDHPWTTKHLLESSVEAMEDGNLDYKGKDVGVFVGGPEHSNHERKETASQYMLVAQYKSTLANMISYKLDLRGPSQTVLTACCSSGTAFHNAVLAIRAGDCNMALVGGTSLLVDPNANSQFDLLNVLSKDGEPKVFDARANGFVSSDGIAVVIIKKLKDAIKDGNKIYSIVRDTVSNSDGGVTKVLTNPSREAHRRNIKKLTERNKVSPDDVVFFECHATGTVVGDPIETGAVGMEIGSKRKSGPLNIGSVKGNIGHTISTAFLSSLIKLCMMIKHNTILPNRGFEVPNPNIKWKDWNLKVPTEPIKLNLEGKLLMVNSFGIGGSNVTALLEGVDYRKFLPVHEPKAKFEPPYLFSICAKSPATVNARIEQLREFAKREDVKGNEDRLMYTINMRKQSHYEFRSVGVGKDIATAKFSKPIRYNWKDEKKSIIFVFAGQGPQSLKMGRQLYKKYSVFRDTIDLCDKIYKELSGVSMIYDTGLFGEKVGCKVELQKTGNTIPSLIMIQIALVELWKSIGIIPTCVVGHSFGEICSMYATGAADLRQVLNLVYTRVKIVNEIKTNGKLIAIGGMNSVEFYDLMDELDVDDIWVAATNAPKTITCGGNPKSVDVVKDHLDKKGTFNRLLKINYAFHTDYVSEIEDLALEKFAEALKGTKKPEIDLLSTTYAQKWKTPITAEYLTENITHEVKFADTIQQLALKNYGIDPVFIELSAHPVLGRSLAECSVENILYSINRNVDENVGFLNNVGRLVTFGYDINWEALGFEGYAPFEDWPKYPWTKTICTIDDNMQFDKFMVTDRPIMPPTIGRKQEAPNESWKTYLSLKRFPWIEDHLIMGNTIAPGALFVQMLLECADDTKIKDVEFFQTMECKDKGHITTVNVFEGVDNSLNIHSRDFGRSTKASWTKNAVAFRLNEKDSVVLQNFDEIVGVMDAKTIIKRMHKEQSGSNLYRAVGEFMDMKYGKSFQRIVKGWMGDDEGISLINTDCSDFEKHFKDLDFVVHPCVLDGIVQTLFFSLEYWIDCYYPMKIGEVVVFDKNLPELVYCYVSKEVIEKDDTVLCQYTVFDEKGKVYLHLRDFVGKKVVFRNEKELPTYTTFFQDKRMPDLKEKNLSKRITTPKVPENFTVKNKIIHYMRKALPKLDVVYDSLPDHSQRQVRWVRNTVKETKDLVIPQKDLDMELKLIKGWETVGEMVDRIGPRFAEMCVNKNNEVHDALFSDGILTRFYSELAILPAYSKMIEAYVAEITKGEGRVVRILELGAGTGSVIRGLFPLLKKYGNKIEYIFSDVSSGYFNSIKEEFKEYSFIRFKVIDCEKSYAEQGITNNSIDIVISFLVIHVAGILQDALKAIHNCLVPNGVLMLAEVDAPIYANYVFGFFSQWWDAKDWRKDSKRLNVCLTPEEYVVEVEKAHMKVVDQVVDNGAGNKMYVIQARKLDVEGEIETKKFDDVFVYGENSTEKLLKIIQNNLHFMKEKKILVVISVNDMVQNPGDDNSAVYAIGTTLRSEYPNWKIILIDFVDVTKEEKEKWLCEAVKFPSKFELENRIVKNVHKVLRMKEIPKESKKATLKIESKAYRLKKELVEDVDPKNPKEGRIGLFQFEIPTLKKGQVLVKVKKSELTESHSKALDETETRPIFNIIVGTIAKLNGVDKFAVGDKITCFVKSVPANYVICDAKMIVKNEQEKFVDIASLTDYKSVRVARIGEVKKVAIVGAFKHESLLEILRHMMRGESIVVYEENARNRKYLKEKYQVSLKPSQINVVFFDSNSPLKHVSSALNNLTEGGKIIQLNRSKNQKIHKIVTKISFEKNTTFIPLVILKDEIKSLWKETLQLANKGKLSLDRAVNTYEDRELVPHALHHIRENEGIKLRKGVQILWNIDEKFKGLDCDMLFSSQKTYIISGGLGAIGWNLVKKMSKYGARYIVCMSRSGRLKKRQLETVSDLYRNGVHVFIAKADVTSSTAVAKMFEDIKSIGFPKVGGIFHMALIIKDEFLKDITMKTFKIGESIKREGSENLMKPFWGSPKDLDFFVWFSSLSCVIGNARQVNYNAGNKYVENLSLKMRKMGYNSYVVNVGAIIDAGLVGQNIHVRREMLDTFKPCPVRFLLKDIFSMLKKGECVYHSDHQRLIGIEMSNYKSSIEHVYGHLFNTQKKKKIIKSEGNVEVTYEILNEIIKDLLMLDSDVDANDDLIYKGVDSVQSIELSSILKKQLNLKVSQADLMNKMSINKLLKIAKRESSKNEH